MPHIRFMSRSGSEVGAYLLWPELQTFIWPRSDSPGFALWLNRPCADINKPSPGSARSPDPGSHQTSVRNSKSLNLQFWRTPLFCTAFFTTRQPAMPALLSIPARPRLSKGPS